MATLTLRIDKGSPLTNAELDSNFAQLNLTKIGLGGDIGGGTGAPVVVSLRGNAVSTATPTTGQALTWSGTQWYPATVNPGPSTVSSTVTSVVTSVVTNTVVNTISSVVTSVAATVVNTTTTTYPAFSAYASNATSQSISYGSQQKVLFQTEEFDTANCYSNSRFTPNVAGYYQINAMVRLDGFMGTASENMIALWKNGSEIRRGWNNSGVSPNAAGTWFAMQVSTLIYANGTTDYFEIAVQHGNTSTALTVTGVNNPGITYFNATYVPTQLITAVSASTTVSSTAASAVGSAVSNAVSSTVFTSAVQNGAGVITVLNDISGLFTGSRRTFTLKNGASPIVEGIEYKDNKDIQVMIGNRFYRPFIPQTATLGPWIHDYIDNGRTYEYRVTGSRIIFNRAPEPRQGADIRINTVSSSRQKRSRYPFSANSIVLGD